MGMQSTTEFDTLFALKALLGKASFFSLNHYVAAGIQSLNWESSDSLNLSYPLFSL